MYLPDYTLLQGGKYKIIHFIASGGFGCTYEAEHVLLKNRVAIKEFFVKDFCNRDEITAHVTVATQCKTGLVTKLRHKFMEEAQALSNFQHLGIVHVTDIFEENGTAYYVMDYIQGESLSEKIKRQGPLSESIALKYIRQVAEALGYVHDHHRLHLDIKPGNIMIDNHDQAILIDFGASKQYDEENGENTSTLMGKTPGYAPLEQMGNAVSHFAPATDIYSLGATLYKLLTGNTPPKANLLVIGDEALNLPSTISKATRDTVMKSMKIKKNERLQSVKEFLYSLPTVQGLQSANDSDTTILDFHENINVNNEHINTIEHQQDFQNTTEIKLVIDNIDDVSSNDNHTNNSYNVNTNKQQKKNTSIVIGAVLLFIIVTLVIWSSRKSNISQDPQSVEMVDTSTSQNKTSNKARKTNQEKDFTTNSGSLKKKSKNEPNNPLDSNNAIALEKAIANKDYKKIEYLACQCRYIPAFVPYSRYCLRNKDYDKAESFANAAVTKGTPSIAKEAKKILRLLDDLGYYD